MPETSGPRFIAAPTDPSVGRLPARHVLLSSFSLLLGDGDAPGTGLNIRLSDTQVGLGARFWRFIL